MQASAFFDVISRVESVLHGLRTVSRDPNARVLAVSTVDKELDSARRLFSSLFTRRNALLPISLLPPEILTRVFHLLGLEEPACLGKKNLSWIRVAHVCQHWRQVALDNPSLWVRISGTPTNIPWILEMLTRAKNAPLDVDIDLVEALDLGVVRLLQPHLSHTRELRIRKLSTPDTDRVRAFYNREAPVLEHFELAASFISPITLRDLGVTTLFKGQAPKLRSLSLSHVLIPWSPIPRGQLTQLVIVNENENNPALGDSNDLIELLVNCPALEILTLDFCLPSQLTRFPRGQTIHLPRLSRLHLSGSTSRVTNLLKMLKLPSSTTFNLRCMSENDASLNEHHILPLVSAHFQSPAPVEFKSLRISIHLRGSSYLAVTASTSLPTLNIRQPPESGDMYKDAELVLTFDDLYDFRHWGGFLEQVCKALHLTKLEFISIDAPEFDASGITDPVNWGELFNGSMDVTGVQAIGHGASSLVRALTISKLTTTKPGGKKKKRGNIDNTSTQPAMSTASPALAAIFPKLKFLSLEYLEFGEKKDPSGVLYDVVERGLQQRQKASESGAPFESLRISCSTISSNRAFALQNIVKKFYWDGWDGDQRIFDPDQVFFFDSEISDSSDVESDDEGFFIGHGTGDWDSDSDPDSDGWENYSDE